MEYHNMSFILLLYMTY